MFHDCSRKIKKFGDHAIHGQKTQKKQIEVLKPNFDLILDL